MLLLKVIFVQSIEYFEKTYGRNDMSFNFYHETVDFPVDPLDFEEELDYFEEVDRIYEDNILPVMNSYSINFPKDKNLEYCKVS